jgi:hypothetical protein
MCVLFPNVNEFLLLKTIKLRFTDNDQICEVNMFWRSINFILVLSVISNIQGAPDTEMESRKPTHVAGNNAANSIAHGRIVLANTLTSLLSASAFIALPVNHFATEEGKHQAHLALSIAGMIIGGTKLGLDFCSQLNHHGSKSLYKVFLHGTVLVPVGLHIVNTGFAACFLHSKCSALPGMDLGKDILTYIITAFAFIHSMLELVR